MKQRFKICDEEHRQRRSQRRDSKAVGRSDSFSGLPEKYCSWDHSLPNWDRVFQRDANFGNLQLVTKMGHDFFNYMHVKENTYVCVHT